MAIRRDLDSIRYCAEDMLGDISKDLELLAVAFQDGHKHDLASRMKCIISAVDNARIAVNEGKPRPDPVDALVAALDDEYDGDGDTAWDEDG